MRVLSRLGRVGSDGGTLRRCRSDSGLNQCPHGVFNISSRFTDLISGTMKQYQPDLPLRALFTGGGDEEKVLKQLEAFEVMLTALADAKAANVSKVLRGVGKTPLIKEYKRNF